MPTDKPFKTPTDAPNAPAAPTLQSDPIGPPTDGKPLLSTHATVVAAVGSGGGGSAAYGNGNTIVDVVYLVSGPEPLLPSRRMTAEAERRLERLVEATGSPNASKPSKRMPREQRLSDALHEVMTWIKNWEPSFVFDPEWPETERKVKEAQRHER